MTELLSLAPLISDQPEALEALCTCLTSDPATGVVLLSPTLEVLYVNPQAAQTFGGPQAVAADYVGISVERNLGAAYAAERRRFVELVLGDGRPRLIRSIWRGRQAVLWYTPLRGKEGAQDRVLAIGRELPGIGAAEALPRGSIELIYARAIDLGPLAVLTPRELEVVALVGAGLTIKEVGQRLHRSPKTVESHRLTAGQKLGLHDRAQLIEVAHRAGLTLEDAERMRGARAAER